MKNKKNNLEKQVHKVLLESLKRKQNQHKQNDKKIIFKYKKLNIRYIKDKIVQIFRSEFVQEISPIVKFILGYGVLGYFTYCFIFLTQRWYIAVPGIGAGIYLVEDLFDFMWDRVSIIWKRNK